MRIVAILAWAFVTFLFVACGKDADQHKEQAPQQKVEAEKPAPVPATLQPSLPQVAPAAEAGAVVEVQIASIADTMTFDKTKLKVPTGAQVHLVLKNNSKLEILPHNWVLVKTGTEAAVAAAGLELGVDAGYIPPGANVLAFTPLAARGQSTEVTFTAPAAGSYPYICTVPGHYVMMKGTLEVSP